MGWEPVTEDPPVPDALFLEALARKTAGIQGPWEIQPSVNNFPAIVVEDCTPESPPVPGRRPIPHRRLAPAWLKPGTAAHGAACQLDAAAIALPIDLCRTRYPGLAPVVAGAP